MASDRITHTRLRYPLALSIVCMLTISGYFAGSDRIATGIMFFITGLVLFLILFGLYEKTEKTVAIFFKSLKNNDTAQQFRVDIRNKTLAKLHENMNSVNLHFQSIRMQSEYNENYYKTLIRHSTAGLLVLNQDHVIELINEAACRYAGISPESTNPNQLKIKNPEFYKAICGLQQGRDVTYKQVIGNEYQLLTFRAIVIKKNAQVLKLVSVQDIRHEIESKELESYRKLISVLTHEIMNQVTPLTSVSKSLQSLYNVNGKPVGIEELDENLLSTTRRGLQLIEEQSEGLTSFINNYRKISKIPKPSIQAFGVDEWIGQLSIVYSDKMRQHDIGFSIQKDHQVTLVCADKNLLNQVMINLINNSMDAVLENAGERKISISISSWQQNRVRIKVMNNGPVIAPEIQEKIFVPFFTTKTNGSGVGLSICQEIIKLHGGSLTLLSSQEGMTSFMAEL